MERGMRMDLTGQQRVSAEQAEDALLLCDSYERADLLVSLIYKMDPQDWLAAVGEWWSGCDNLGAYQRWFSFLLPDRGPVDVMMTPEEREAWQALPEQVTIYRGTRRPTVLGASWSLDRDVAVRFPTLNRYRHGGPPWLITATVRKRNILAIKLDREEAEAIVFRGRRIVSREPLPE